MRWLVLGVAMLLVDNAIGLGRSTNTIYVGQTAITLPYVTFLLATPRPTRASSACRGRT